MSRFEMDRIIEKLQRRRMATSVAVPPDTKKLLYSFPTGPEAKTPFEYFLDYSTQKQLLAEFIARRLLESNGKHKLSVVDIGTSKGTLLAFLISELRRQGMVNPIHFHLVEPDKPSFLSLTERTKFLEDFTRHSPYRITTQVYNSTWENLTPQTVGIQNADAVICSHTLYHFPPDQFEANFHKMTGILQPGGKLIVAAREKDPIYNFIHEFFTPATGRQFNELTINDARAVLHPMAAANPGYTLEDTSLEAKVTFPFGSNPEVAQGLVGFFLQTTWPDIPPQVQSSIYSYLTESQPIDIDVQQFDGVLTVSKQMK